MRGEGGSHDRWRNKEFEGSRLVKGMERGRCEEEDREGEITRSREGEGKIRVSEGEREVGKGGI